MSIWKSGRATASGFWKPTVASASIRSRRSSMAILKHGALQPNDWLTVADDAALPEGKPAVVSLDRWLKERDVLIGRPGDNRAPLGVRLRSDQSPMSIADDLERVELIVL